MIYEAERKGLADEARDLQRKNPMRVHNEIARLEGFGTATVHEVLGRKGAFDSGIRPIDPGMSVAGPAFTVESVSGDNLAIQYAVSVAPAGHVLVVDAGGSLEAGPWGDLLTLAAQQRNIAGLIIDGCVRDSAAIIEMDFPVFSRGISIKGTTKDHPGRVNQPIVCGGVRVRPGDVVVGDRDGVVAVPQERLAEVLDAARDRIRSEESIRVALHGGAALVDLLGLEPKIREHGYTK